MTGGSKNGSGASNDTRGLFMIGSDTSGTVTNSVHYITIAQASDSMDFGDLTSLKAYHSSCCCGTRVLVGYCQSSGGGYSSIIDSIEISSLSNATQFGTISVSRMQSAACTNGLRGVFGGGLSAGANSDIIEYLDASYMGNPINFGSLTVARGLLASSSGN